MGGWYMFLFGPDPEEPEVPTPRVTGTTCAECRADIQTRHCEGIGCDWFLCGRDGVLTEASTGRSMSYQGPRR